MISFDTFMSQLKDTNATLGFFTDFRKVSANVSKISMKLNQLNFLLGKEDLEAAVRMLYEENPKVFSVLDILVAVRKRDKKLVLNDRLEAVLVDSYLNEADSILKFIEGTGLAELFHSGEIKNLVDYVFGVEVGLDTNARKNRSGDQMANAVASYFNKFGIVYVKEVNSTEFEGLEILGKDKKRFDFVIKTREKVFLIETNFYNGGGSKLNEVARSYSDIAPKINSIPGYEFVWITDGKGWLSAGNKLEEAWRIIPRIYNLTTLTDFVSEVKALQ